MRKLITLFFTLLFCVAANAQPVAPKKAARNGAMAKPVNKEVVGKRLTRQLDRKAQTLPQGMYQSQVTIKGLSSFSKAKKSPAKAAVSTDKLIGALVYPDNSLCQMNTNGEFTRKIENAEYSAFGVADGKIYAFRWITNGEYVQGAFFDVIDMASWTVENTIDLSSRESFFGEFVQTGVFVPEEKCFYGGTNDGWIKYDVTTNTATTLVAGTAWASAMPSTLCWNSEAQKVVGVDSRNGDVYEINKDTGTSSKVGSIDFKDLKYTAGLAYDAAADCYLWNPNSDAGSYLVAVDPTTYAVTELCKYEKAEFGYMVCYEASKFDPEGPKAAVIDNVDFKGNALTGVLTFTMPTETLEDKALTGDVDYEVLINGKSYKKAVAAAGAKVILTIGADAGLASGMATFQVICSQNGKVGKSARKQFYVGNDVPCSPKNVKLTPGTVSWDAVTEGVHGRYVDAEAMTYNVSINGKQVATGVKGTSCASTIPYNEPLTLYTAEVVAVCNGMVSEPGKSNELPFGTALPLPVEMEPSIEQSKLFTIVDANADDFSWKLYENSNPAFNAFMYSYNEYDYLDADDWLFLPAVSVNTTTELVAFAMDAWAGFESYPEKVEVRVGTAPTVEAMTTTVIGPTDIASEYDDRQNLKGYFKAAETGKYYIGIHAISDSYGWELYVNNFRVSQSNVATAGPAAVENAKAVGAEKGELKATVTFDMPKVNNVGGDLEGDVTATVTTSVDSKSVTGAPGAAMTVEVATEQGDNIITVQTSQGDLKGMPITLSVFTGTEAPASPNNLKATVDRTNMVATFTWDAPTEGVDGGYLKPGGITYWVVDVQEIFGQYFIRKVQKIGTDVYSAQLSLPEGTPQDAYNLYILAENFVGEGGIAGATVAIGTPYDTPAAETWTDEAGEYSINYEPVLINSANGKISYSITAPYIMNAPYNTTDAPYILRGVCREESTGYVDLPKFSTLNQDKVAFIPNVYIGSCKNMRFAVSSYDVAEEVVLDMKNVVNDKTGYTDVVIDLPAKFQNKEWIQVRIYVDFDEDHYLFLMPGYKLRNMVPNDLAVSIQGATQATVGEAANFEAIMTSVGTSSANYKGGKFTVSDAEGNVLYSKDVTADVLVESDKTTTSSYSFVPDVNNIGEVTVKFEMTGGDACDFNNTAEMTCKVVKGHALVVDDLEASLKDGKATLDWTAVHVSGGEESWEDYSPFELSGDKIGLWTNVASGSFTYWFNPNVYPDINTLPNADKIANKSGYIVVDGEQLGKALGEDGEWNAPEGKQFLIAFCPGADPYTMVAPDADEWLISPAVEGGSDFSFEIRPIVNDFGAEIIEICYSTENTDDPKAFQVLETKEIGGEKGTPAEWEEVKVTLPADAKRVAIHYVSNDVFGICVDDMIFTPEGGVVTVKGYDVYRAEGESEAFELIGRSAANTYVDDTANLDVKNSYYVIPVLSNDTEGMKSNIAILDLSGIGSLAAGQYVGAGKGEIVLKGFEGMRVAISTADGKVVSNAVAADLERVAVPAGVYVVKAGKKAAKVIVR